MASQTHTTDPDMPINICPHHASPATAAAADLTPYPPQPGHYPPTTKTATPSAPSRRGPSPDLYPQLLPNNHRLGLSESPPLIRCVLFAAVIITGGAWVRESLGAARYLSRPEAVFCGIIFVLLLVALVRAAGAALRWLMTGGFDDEEEEEEKEEEEGGRDVEEEMGGFNVRNRSAAWWESVKEGWEGEGL